MERLTVDVECPGCRRKLELALVDIKPGNSKKCPRCRAVMKFSGDDLRKVQEAFDKLDARLSRMLNREIKIEF